MFSFTLLDLLEKNLSERGDHPALILGEKRLTYGELGAIVENVAAWLHEQGVQRWDRVAIHLHKSFEEVAATFAIARIGGVSVNINYHRTIRQIRHIVGDCDVRILITDRRKAESIIDDGLIDVLDKVVVVGKAPNHPKVIAWDALPKNGEAPNVRPVDADLASLLYTSGSTGLPKGVMITHLNFLDGSRRVARYLKNNAADRILGLVPMSAPWGTIQITTMFMVGGSVVLQPVAFPAEIVKTLIAKDVTGMAAFPETWLEIIPYLKETELRLPSLRYITSSGGKIPNPILEAMPEVLPTTEVFLTYGLTEAFRSTYLPPPMFRQKMGSFGKSCYNVDVFVVNPVKGICGPGEQGELIHRGTLVTPGYWRNPEATNERLRVCEHLRPYIGDEKVHYSGDIVRIDEDGYFWFVGRVESLIKCSGYRISPTEVEEVIYESGMVDTVVAFGMDDEQGVGQVVHIAVCKEKGDFDIVALQKFCARNMPTYMIPREIHCWPGRMPRTDTGKIDRLTVVGTFTGAGGS